jgi:BRCT domain type II-containing protein
MHRSTRSSASRGPAQDLPTQLDPTENPSPVNNNTSTDGATSLSSTTVPRFTDEIEARAKNAFKRSSRDLFDIKSTAVFPYLLEPDKTMGFPFSVEANKPHVT